MKKITKKLSLFLVIVMLVTTLVTPAITANAAIFDNEYNENEPDNDYFETAGRLYKDYTVYGYMEAGDSAADGYVFTLSEQANVTVQCYAQYSTLEVYILDYNTHDIIYRLSNTSYEDLWVDYINVKLSAGSYYIVLMDSQDYNYSSYEYILYFDYESTKPTLAYQNGKWVSVLEGEFTSITGLVEYQGKYFYVVNGYWRKNVTDVIKYNGKWFYVVDGKWANKTTTLFKKNGSWLFIQKGKWTSQTAIASYQGKYFYIKGGKWINTANGILKCKGKYYYIKSGKWQEDYSGFVKRNNTFFYVENGKWQNKMTALVKSNGTYYYVKSGKWSRTTAIVKFSGKRFFVKYGIAQLNYSGWVTVGGKAYKIKKGKVV